MQMKTILERLFEHDTLGREEARDTLLSISRGEQHDVHVTAFVTVYNMRPITLAELQGFRDALMELCVPLDVNGRETVDIVGTGGDSKNTFNISTTSAIVLAGAGYAVTKHGSYGVSSSVGSSDVLLALGYEFTNDADTLRRQLDRSGICFLHAPLFHPAMKTVVPVRKQLGMKTFFNMLGPLVNPVQPKYQLFGTFNLGLSRLYQYIMQQTDRRFAIVHALDGYDEISLTGPFNWRTPETEKTLAPDDLNRRRLTQQDLHGGHTSEEAAKIMIDIFNNEAPPAHFAVVTANAGMAIHSIKPDSSIPDCLAEAEESIRSGRAKEVLQSLLS